MRSCPAPADQLASGGAAVAVLAGCRLKRLVVVCAALASASKRIPAVLLQPEYLPPAGSTHTTDHHAILPGSTIPSPASLANARDPASATTTATAATAATATVVVVLESAVDPNAASCYSERRSPESTTIHVISHFFVGNTHQHLTPPSTFRGPSANTLTNPRLNTEEVDAADPRERSRRLYPGVHAVGQATEQATWIAGDSLPRHVEDP